MKRICPACARVIEDSERYQVCSICKYNYHDNHACPDHPDAPMILCDPRAKARSRGQLKEKPVRSSPQTDITLSPNARRSLSLRAAVAIVGVIALGVLLLVSWQRDTDGTAAKGTNVMVISFTKPLPQEKYPLKDEAQIVEIKEGQSQWEEAKRCYSLSGASQAACFEKYFGKAGYKFLQVAMRTEGKQSQATRKAPIVEPPLPTTTTAQSAPQEDKVITINVSSKRPWTDTGLTVSAGDTISIKASGTVTYGDPASQYVTGPDGTRNRAGTCSYVVTNPRVPAQSLIGNIADSPSLDGRGFFVGSKFKGVVPMSGTTKQTGKLLLGFNDGAVNCDRSGYDAWGFGGDNRGTFTAVVTVVRAPDGRGRDASPEAHRKESTPRRLPPVAEVGIRPGRTIRPGWPTKDFRISQDGKRIATVGPGIQVWNAETGELERHLRSSMRGLGGAYSVAISPDGETVAQGGFRRVVLWDVNAARERLVFDAHRSFITSIAFSRDGHTLATVGNGNNWDDSGHDTALRLWDPRDGRIRRTVDEHGGGDIEFSSDGRLLAGLSVIVWESESGARRWRKEVGRAHMHAAGPAKAFSSDGGMLAAVGARGIYLFDAISGRVLRDINVPGGLFSAVAFSADGRVLVTGQEDGMIRFWDPESGEKVRVSGESDLQLRAHEGAVTGLWFSPDGQTLASGSFHQTGREDRTVRLWRISLRQQQ